MSDIFRLLLIINVKVTKFGADTLTIHSFSTNVGTGIKRLLRERDVLTLLSTIYKMEYTRFTFCQKNKL